jgi:hypothetical protein
MAGNSHNMKISTKEAGKTQHGVYDPQILCAACDGKLGQYDDYALEVFRRFPDERVLSDDGTFTMINVNGDDLAKFILAVLWRASVSPRPEFQRVELGPYEADALEVLFGTRPLASMTQYQLMAALYRSPAGKPAEFVSQFYSSPVRTKIDGLNCWQMSLRGFKFVAKLDRRPLPNIWHRTIINGGNKLFGAVLDFEGTVEHRAMLRMAGADLERRRSKRGSLAPASITSVVGQLHG